MTKYDSITDRQLHLPMGDVYLDEPSRADIQAVRFWSDLTHGHSYGIYLGQTLLEIVSTNPLRQLVWWDQGDGAPEMRNKPLLDVGNLWDSSIEFAVRKNTPLSALVDRLILVIGMGSHDAARMLTYQLCVVAQPNCAKFWCPDNKD